MRQLEIISKNQIIMMIEIKKNRKKAEDMVFQQRKQHTTCFSAEEMIII